jgi:hypothetical protein
MFSSEGMRSDEHPNAILSQSQPQPQRANALGLELDVSRPPTPGLAEILSDLALDLDAVCFGARSHLLLSNPHFAIF